MSEKRPAVAAAAAALSRPCVLIIVVASVERFAYKGVASNLVTYLTGVVGMSSAAAAKSVSAWSGVNFMLPLFSAILADSCWDRYSTITGSSLIYVLGMVGLTTWALLRTWMSGSTLFLPLYLISLGQAGYNPSLQAFGADQLDIGDDSTTMEAEEKAKVKSKFFQWWYFGICTGGLLGNSTLPYVQDNCGWGLGFAIPCVVMAMSVVAFFCCTPLYKQKQLKSTGTPTPISIVKVVKSVLGSVGSRKIISLPSKDDNGDATFELELQEKPLRDPPDPAESAEEAAAPSVANVILGLLPIWTMMLMFAVIFQQPMTFFTEQGMLMDHSVGGGAFVIPPAMLQSSINVSIILLVPVYDKMIVPFTNLITGRRDSITVLQRIGVGMVLSIVAMVIAALVESWRLRVRAATGGGARLSIFWLLPQYVLLGVADVFTVVGMQEFFYTQVPSSMKTIGIGLNTSVFGFGSFLGAFLITVLEMATGKDGSDRGWFADDPQEAHLDKYYWFLAFLCSISFLIFASLCKYYNVTDASAG